MTDFQKAKEAAIAAIEEIEPIKTYGDSVLAVALSAFREAGYVLVPVKPPIKMRAAFDDLAYWAERKMMPLNYDDVHAAMLTAAQKEQEG